MGTDAGTFAAVAALAVAFVALLIAFAQALQQYLVSGQLIRICDSVVYGNLPGQGHRVWEFSQFRFRVVYSIPQIGLSPSLWLGISSHVRASKYPSKQLPSLGASNSRKTQSAIAGEASWMSFTRTVQHSCDQSLRYTMVEGDADRCPADLPVVPMQLSMRDVVVVAIMAGMDCTDVSFQSQSLSMQGEAGTITSSRHPVLGSLIHFAPKQALGNHGIRAKNGTVNPQWVARMVGSISVAGCKYDLRDRKHFEEDESSWIQSAGVQNAVKSKGRMVLSSSSTLRQRRHPRPGTSTPADRKSTVDAFGARTVPEYHRPQDGKWSFSPLADESLVKPSKLQKSQPDQLLDQSVNWINRMGSSLRHTLRKANSSQTSTLDTEVLPISEPKNKHSQSKETQAIKGQPLVEPRSEDQMDPLINNASYRPAQTHLRRGTLTAYIADGRQLESTRPYFDKDTHPKMHQLLLKGNDNADSLQSSSPDAVDGGLVEPNSNRDDARNDYVVNKWQKIFKQRRNHRSRGRSRDDGTALLQYRGSRRPSPWVSSGGTVAGTKLNGLTKGGQLRIKDRDFEMSSDSDAGLHGSGSVLRQQDYSKSTEQPQRLSTKVSTSSHHVTESSPRRGRRRNSSLAKKPTRSELLAYGHVPIRAEKEPSHSDESHQRISAGSRIPGTKRRKVLIVSPEDTAAKDPEIVVPITSPLKMGIDRDAPSHPPQTMDAEILPPLTSSYRTSERKSILRQPTKRFPEEAHPVREGVAPLKLGKRGVPEGAKWTKIDRRLVNPEALDLGNERYEERADFVIVLRVLSKDEIEQYALKTQEIRGMIFAYSFVMMF